MIEPPTTERELPPEAEGRIRANLERCRGAIAAAARRSGRDPSSVQLVAVTKYVGPAEVRALHKIGVRDFGESTVQGIERKLEALPELAGARWHMIGHLQRNKAARAMQLCHAVQSIDSERLARELGSLAERRGLPVPELWVELNLTDDAAKTGLAEAQLEPVLARLASDARLAPRVAGLMAMAPHGGGERARAVFRRLRELLGAMRAKRLLPAEGLTMGGAGLSMGGAGLSMGMSGDFVEAVEEGATLVRVGSMLFEEAG